MTLAISAREADNGLDTHVAVSGAGGGHHELELRVWSRRDDTETSCLVSFDGPDIEFLVAGICSRIRHRVVSGITPDDRMASTRTRSPDTQALVTRRR